LGGEAVLGVFEALDAILEGVRPLFRV